MMFRLRIPGLARDHADPNPADTLYSAISDYRRTLSLTPLHRNPSVESTAKKRSELAMTDWELSGVLRHDNPNVAGDRYFELLPAYGISSWEWAGEVLALNGGFADPIAEAMRGWDQSVTHREILVGDWDQVGVGITSRGGVGVYVAVFLDS